MRIAIVGGSLAGALLALQLRDGGHQISIFDLRAPWEKPCGGAVNAEVFRQFPILGELPCSWHCPSKSPELSPSMGRESRRLSNSWVLRISVAGAGRGSSGYFARRCAKDGKQS